MADPFYIPIPDAWKRQQVQPAQLEVAKPLPGQPVPPAAGPVYMKTPGEWQRVKQREEDQLYLTLSPYAKAAQEILRTSANPIEDMDRMVSSAYLAERLNVPVMTVYKDHDVYAEAYWGRAAPVKTWTKAIQDNWSSAELDQKIAMLRWKQMTGDTTPETEQQIELYRKQKPTPEEQRRSFPVELLKSAANMAPYMWENFKYSLPTGLAMGGVAAGVAAMTGAEVAIPPLFARYFMRGMSMGSSVYTFQAEAGLNYDELVENGIPKEIALVASLPVGAVNAALEQLEISNIPGVSKLLGSIKAKLTSEVLKETVVDGTLTKLAKKLLGDPNSPWKKFLVEVGKEYVVKGLIAEPATELMQESMNVVSGYLATAYTNATRGLDIPQATIEAVGKRLLEIYTETTKSMLVMGLGAFVRAGRQAATVTKTATAEQQAGAKPATATTPATTAAVESKLYRTPEKRLYTAIQEGTEAKEGTRNVLKAGDPEKHERYGYVRYVDTGTAINVTDVVSEAKTENITRELVQDLAARNPGKSIEWNPTTEAQVEIKEDLIASNPRGTQYGLQWYEAPVLTELEQNRAAVMAPTALEAPAALTRDYFEQQMAKAFNLKPEEREFFGWMAQRIADKRGVTADNWLAQYLAPEVVAATPETEEVLAEGRGVAGTMFKVEGKTISPFQVDAEEVKGRVRATFTALQGADFHHGVHEFFHMVERLALSPEEIGMFEHALGALRETWTTDHVERLADLFEAYLASGKAPTPELRTVFERVADLLGQVFSFLLELAEKGQAEVSPEMRAAFDSLFANQQSPLAQTRAQNIRVPVWRKMTREEAGLPPKPLWQEVAEPQPAEAKPETTTYIDPSVVPPQEVAIERITLSRDVPQFKEEANAQGVVAELTAKQYIRLDTAPIVLWERTNGDLEVVTGRHRLDLAQRLGEASIPSQIVREVDGFTAAMALTFDAESNIRNEKGSVRDYALYFRNTEIDEETARSRGLLDSDKGRKGFAVGRYATDGLYALYRNNGINETKAAAISAATKGDERLTGDAILQAKKLPAEELSQYILIRKSQLGEATSAGQADLFGRDDSAMVEAAKIAQEAVRKLNELRSERVALKGYDRLSRGEAAKVVEKYGFKAGDTAAIQTRVAELDDDIQAWQNWMTDAGKQRELRARAGLDPAVLYHASPEDFVLAPLTEAELAAMQEYEKRLIRNGKRPAQQTFDFAKKTDTQLRDERANYRLFEEQQKALFHHDFELEAKFNALAAKTFGITTDIEKGCWILSDGRMLDFTPKPNKASTHGRMYHAEIKAVTDKVITSAHPEAAQDSACRGAWYAGALRIDQYMDMLVIQSTKAPTRAQFATLKDVLPSMVTVQVEVVTDDINERPIGYKKFTSPSVEKLKDFYVAPEMFDPTRALYHDLDQSAREALLRMAKGYESAEAFKVDQESLYGEGEAPVADYKAIWEEAHKEPEVPQPEPEIPGPETPEGEYDYSSKVTLAREAANPELSQRLETGEATEAELDKLAAKQPAVDAKMQATIDGVQAQLDKMLPGFSIEEQHVLMLADELAALSATEAKAKRLQGRVRSLEGRLKTALGRDAKLSLLLTDYEEGFRSGSEIQKGIAATRARLTELTEQDRRAETQAKMYVAKQTELARLKEWYRKRDAERRALLGYRELRKSLLKEIIRPPSAMVEYRGYADAILQIQRGLDPKRHTESVMREREKSRAYFDANPEAAALVPPERLDAIYSVPMADMSVRQLEEIQATIESLRDLGFKKRSIKLSQQFNARKLSKKLMVNAALRGEPPKDVIGGAKPSSEAMKLYLATLKPGRVAQMLDGIFAGITKSGEFWRMLVEDPNKNWNAMQKTIRKRQERVLAKMEELKLTPDPFAFKRLAGYTYLGQTLDIAYNGENFTMTNGEKPTVQKAMYWYIGMRNARTEAALLAGNKYPVEVIEAGIARLTPQMKEMADTIVQDFRDNQGRLHDAFVDIFNEDLPLEDNYLPMTRLQVSYETRNERVAAELTARAGVRKQFVARNPTYARIEIADEHQKPIADDIFNVWFEGVKIQEGFIHQDRMIKDMHSVLESDDVRNALQQRYGPAINKWMSKYINDLAQADSYATRQGIERWSRIARSNAAVAWLGFNLLSAGKQLWGAVNFLADTGPIYLAGAAAQFAAGKGKSVLHGKLLNNTLVDFVDSRSELVRHRQISQELQDLKRIDVTTYERLMQKVGGLGMNLLEVLDHATCVIGWKAMYDKVLRATKNEAMAIKAADEAVVRTQPSMRVQDAAEIYRSGEIMKWFTMFTSEMSAIWNRLAFDVPAAIRNGQLLSASADLLSIGIGGLGIALASGAMHGDDPEKKKQMLMVGFFGQYFEAIPLIGNDIYSGFSTLVTGKSRAANQGVRIFPYLDFVNRVPGNINADNYDKAIENLVQAMAMAAGLPVSGPKRMIKAISTRDAAALLGWE